MVGFTGLALAAAVSLVVVTGGAASTTQKVTEVGFAAPEKPTDYGWNQQGLIGAKRQGHGREGARRDTGDDRRRAEPTAACPAGRRPHHRARLRLQRSRADGRGGVRRSPSGTPRRAPPKKWLVSTSSRRRSRAHTSRVCSPRSSREPARSASSCRRRRELVQAVGWVLPGCCSVSKGVKFRYARIGQVVRRRRRRQARDAHGDRRRRRRRLRHGRRLVVRDDAGRGTAKPPPGRGRCGSSTSSATSGGSTRRRPAPRSCGLLTDLHAPSAP